VWNQVLQYIAVKGVRRSRVAGRTEANTYDATVTAAWAGGIDPPAICFADGDAFTSCCSSINLSFNGTSLALNRTNYFWRDYMRTQISSDDAARIYKSAGGAYDQGDAVGVCVPIYGAGGGGGAVYANPAARQTNCQAGLTVDSGIAERCKTLYALLQPQPTAANGGTRILQVSYPVPVAPLNPWRGYSVPSTSRTKARFKRFATRSGVNTTTRTRTPRNATMRTINTRTAELALVHQMSCWIPRISSTLWR